MKFKYGIGILALLFGSLSAYLIMKLDVSKKTITLTSSYEVKKKIENTIKPLVVKEEIKKIKNSKANKA